MSIHAGDCLKILPSILPESVDLVVTDPPYNIGIDYGCGAKADKRDDYDVWCQRWVDLCVKALRPTGSMWVISGQEHGADIDIAIRRAGMTVRNRITWHETFGVYCQRKFGRTSRPIFYAVKDPKRFTFNRGSVTVPSSRQSKYNDRRASPGGKIMGDVWQINRVCGTFRERVNGVPTQLPETLVRRIIGVSSNSGELVLDPFSGSGTTLAVAVEMGRNAIGCELNPEYIELANQRIAKSKAKTPLFC